MKLYTEIFIPDETTSEQVRGLTSFFRETGKVKITVIDRVPAKSATSAISIIVQIVGTWAAEKYLLDPLASRASEWFSALHQAGAGQNSYRKFSVKLTFEDVSDFFDVEFLETSNLELLKRTWDLVEQIVPVRQAALSEGIQLTIIQFLADSTSEPLVVGSDINGDTWVIDLVRNTVLPEKVNTGDIWILSQLIRRHDYLISLQRGGYALSGEEMEDSQMEIASRKADIQVSAGRDEVQDPG